jgi:hypothetical protein
VSKIKDHTDDTWSFGKLTLRMGLDGVGLGCCLTGGNNLGPEGGGGGYHDYCTCTFFTGI